MSDDEWLIEPWRELIATELNRLAYLVRQRKIGTLPQSRVIEDVDGDFVELTLSVRINA